MEAKGKIYPVSLQKSGPLLVSMCTNKKRSSCKTINFVESAGFVKAKGEISRTRARTRGGTDRRIGRYFFNEDFT